MLPATSPKRKPKGGKPSRVNYVGIVADAKTLGVSRSHLYRVLEGKRRSDSLLSRYHALKANPN